MTLVRMLTHDDIQECVALELACFPDSAWNRKQLIAELERTGAVCLVASQNNGDNGRGIIGLALGWAITDQAELTRVAVSPPHRRNGVSKQLLKGLYQRVAASGATKIFLEVREDNLAAIALYEQMSWKIVGRRKGYYKDGMDALAMERPL